MLDLGFEHAVRALIGLTLKSTIPTVRYTQNTSSSTDCNFISIFNYVCGTDMFCIFLSGRQMIMFSATWPSEVDQLSKEFMGPNPIKVIRMVTFIRKL